MRVIKAFKCIEKNKKFVEGDDYEADKKRIHFLQKHGFLAAPAKKQTKPKPDKNGAPKEISYKDLM